ncbi:MAG: bifunctional adenosylcobinamide kinase/adenosylcobinamide-phosphate guanylyltransferase [Candidatus Omnitrophota bacterium]
MGKIILVLGGARSGKSTYAVGLAKKHKKVAFIATCQGRDKEMKERILKHKISRPKSWKTFEEPKEVEKILSRMGNKSECIIIDCITLLVSNLILCGNKEKEIINKICAVLRQLKKKKARIILVSNEVGLGIVPDNKLSRDFRDIAGRVNQILAKESRKVFFMVSGIPLRIK